MKFDPAQSEGSSTRKPDEDKGEKSIQPEDLLNKKLAISSCTLRIKDKKIQNEFTSYVR